MKFVSPSCLLASAQEGSNCQSIITACITVSTSSGGLLYALISPRSFFVKGFQSLHRGTKSVCRHDTCVRDENSSIAICTLTAYSSAGRASSRSFRVASAKCWQCNSSSAIFSLRAATVFSCSSASLFCCTITTKYSTHCFWNTASWAFVSSSSTVIASTFWLVLISLLRPLLSLLAASPSSLRLLSRRLIREKWI